MMAIDADKPFIFENNAYCPLCFKMLIYKNWRVGKPITYYVAYDCECGIWGRVVTPGEPKTEWTHIFEEHKGQMKKADKTT